MRASGVIVYGSKGSTKKCGGGVSCSLASLSPATFVNPFIDSWFRLFTAHLLARLSLATSIFKDSGSWVYNTVTFEPAQNWASRSFFFHDQERVDDATVNKLIRANLHEAIPYKGSGIVVGFFGRFLGRRQYVSAYSLHPFSF